MVRSILVLSLFAGVAGCGSNPPAAASSILEPRPKLCAALVKARRETPAAPAEAAALIRQFFATADSAERKGIATKLESLPEYAPDRLSGWLHGAGLFAPMKSGISTVRVTAADGKQREVYVRIPTGYAPDKAWPAIYALHPSGGNGYQFLSTVEYTLGDAIEEFVVIAPKGIRQTTVDAPGPENPENVLIWKAVRRQFHLDPNRMYGFGFSLGGFAAWTNASMHPDAFAGVITFSGTILPLELDRYVDAFARNMQGQKCLLAWGAHDTMGISGTGGDGIGPTAGTMCEWNRTLSKRLKVTGPETEAVEDPSRGHIPFPLREESLARVLTHARNPFPSGFDRVFRYLYQSDSYWVQGTSWTGSQWTELRPKFAARPGESDNDALDRTVMSLMGTIHASADDNQLEVETTHLASVRVWLCDPLVDWAKPVLVRVNGKTVFEGNAKRDLLTCLTEAAATYDFDLLKWQKIGE